ncbi:sulfite exporter TauE/SafE family protein, partial [Nocardioides sp.]|uniref:sulfite exporter TauE/SafE family protein n=1 Tax=Nocardioides sp. TaxID=35761 RepID=UPI002EDABC37
EPPAAGGRPGGVSTLARPQAAAPRRSRSRTSPTAVAVVALLVGLLTGFFGVGGGFVVVPALVLVLGVPMQQAVGTSLLIVALNSGTSLLSRIGGPEVDWTVVLPFAVAAMVAAVLGKRVADRLPARRLAVGFAVLLILVAGYTSWQSLAGITG